LRAATPPPGPRVRWNKPVVTGLDEPAEEWPHDHELLASLCGMEPAEVSPLRYGAAVSPHLAARLQGGRIERSEVLAGATRSAEAASAAGAALIVEGVGGLLVPLADDFSVR